MFVFWRVIFTTFKLWRSNNTSKRLPNLFKPKNTNIKEGGHKRDERFYFNSCTIFSSTSNLFTYPKFHCVPSMLKLLMVTATNVFLWLFLAVFLALLQRDFTPKLTGLAGTHSALNSPVGGRTSQSFGYRPLLRTVKMTVMALIEMLFSRHTFCMTIYGLLWYF